MDCTWYHKELEEAEKRVDLYVVKKRYRVHLWRTRCSKVETRGADYFRKFRWQTHEEKTPRRRRDVFCIPIYIYM
jgi:hypothetical protein